MNSLIINEPSLQTLRQRFAYSIMTLVFWVVWIYIWLPLISLAAWYVGVSLFYQEMIVQNGYLAFLQLIAWYALVILIIGCILLGWAGYNLFRFRGKERRISLGSVEKTDIAVQFGVTVDQIIEWRGARRMVIHHSDTGDIDRVDV